MRFPRKTRAFMLVEAAIATLVLSLVFVALARFVIFSIRATQNSHSIKLSTQLSTELMEEVRLRRWDEDTPLPVKAIEVPTIVGLDTGETAGDKRTFDDIDDFNGWIETSVMDPVMRAVAGLEGIRRTVSVSYVDSNFNAAGGTTDYKYVRVCTQISSRNPICVNTVFTNH